MLARGMWAMTEPWGLLYKKLFAWLFFFICFLFSLYKFIVSRASSGSHWTTQKMQNLMYSIMSLTFVVGGIFLFLVGEPKARPWGIAAILFFGVCGLLYYRKAKKEN
jgi:phosphatidylglycerophosphate synthase